MSELTDILIQASESNLAIAVMIVGLAFVDLIQTRYLTARMKRMSNQMQKIEERQWNHLREQDDVRVRQQKQGQEQPND